MTVTTLDAKTALVVVDLQKGIVSRPLTPPMEGVVKQAAALAEAFADAACRSCWSMSPAAPRAGRSSRESVRTRSPAGPI